MTMHVLVGAVPSPSICADFANAAAEWELDGVGPGLSYRIHRTALSYLEMTTARSLDPRSRAVGFVPVPLDVGQGANTVSDALSPNIAALVHWRCAPSERRKQSWTYAACLTHDHVESPAAVRLNDAAAVTLTACFQGLLSLIGPRQASVVVALSRPTGRNHLPGYVPSLIEDVDMGDRRLATQRRRLRRGR